MAINHREIARYFRLKKPCSNCPFLKVGAIELAPGRLDDITKSLVQDDQSSFLCHKIVHSRLGGTWNDETGLYASSGNESMCAGAAAYLIKIGRPTIGMRLAFATQVISPSQWDESHQDIIDAPVEGQGRQKL